MHPAVVGALLNSALYLVSVFVAGIVAGHPLAWKLAIAAMGVTYLSYLAQIGPRSPERGLDFVSFTLVGFSMMFGFLAGLALLF